MEYKDSYRKTVMVNTDKDLDGNPIDTSLKHVVSFYIDRDAEVVGIFPLLEDGYTKEDILSVQPVKHELFTEHLIEVED